MGKQIVKLKLSESVAGDTESWEDYVPVSGAEVWVESFVTEGAFDPNATVKLVWDYQGVGEETVWCSEGSSRMPFVHEVTGADGVRRLALVLENANTGPVYLAGYAEIVELT